MLDPALRTRIDGLVRSHRIVLFMKGTRAAPRCGFSAAAVGALSGLTDQFLDVDVLADEELRQGLKLYANWPTIPQLFIDGELVGGSDIILGMVNSGELHAALGLPAPDRTPPQITITAPAAEAIAGALEDAGDDVLHLAIDAAFRAQFTLKPVQPGAVVAESAGIALHMDLASAQRARGLTIDWAETAQGAGLVLRNPNAPAPVPALSVHELRSRLAAGAITVVDVRPATARALAPFAGARVLETEAAALEALPKDTPLAFLCHHGNSSRGVAERFRALGFSAVHNVIGGIDAWSQAIDPAVPRY